MIQTTHTFSSSGAFVDLFTLEPYQSGPLEGLSFAVKDNIDVAGYHTTYGSPAWKAKHPAATYHALCVEQVLGAGATCLGKTVSDEYTYSLDGEGAFYGTPVNPKAPARIPGGSSSGSASAVACGLVDFALGTDCAGSIRVPASLCGVYGMRPSMHRISEAGVLPFVPSSSTVGAFAATLPVLDKVMRTLLRSGPSTAAPIRTIYLLEDAFALADEAVSEAIKHKLEAISARSGLTMIPISLSDIVGEPMTLSAVNTEALRPLQTWEFMNTVCGWVAQNAPQTGPMFVMKYDTVRHFERSDVNPVLAQCELLFGRICAFTQPGDLFLYPTLATIAPMKGSLNEMATAMDFYDRTMAITAFAGVGRLPEITVPIACVDGAPVGMSVAAGHYQDEFLLSAVARLFPSPGPIQ
ncbi:amidase family protein [Ferrimonas pelagia]|uniref:Amidase n=1 Tax=Ferrimonas pelagia TaxID=1177826 RepID=A0ABP9F0J7_9GAMM